MQKEVTCFCNSCAALAYLFTLIHRMPLPEYLGNFSRFVIQYRYKIGKN